MKSFEHYLKRQERTAREKRLYMDIRRAVRRTDRDIRRLERTVAVVSAVTAVFCVVLAALALSAALSGCAKGVDASEAPMPSEAVSVAAVGIDAEQVPPVVEAPAALEPIESTAPASAIEATPDVNEAEMIEEALVAQGYFREDIPLSFEEQDFLHTACEEFGVPYELAVAVVWKETTFRNIKGDGGKSYGYMQVKKGCHEERMAALGVTDLMDPYSNFRVGCHYLAELLEKYDGNVEMALMAYNAGSGNANKWWFSQGVYSNEYSQKVLGYMEGVLYGHD